jgi:fatty-acyl-CoA synthase
MPPGEGIVVEMVEETCSPAAARASATGRSATGGGQLRQAGARHGGRDPRRRGGRLCEREIGKVHCRGPSVMAGYFRDEEATDACLDEDGWLDTGDMGYLSDGYLYIVGRAKDMIIINGKNHWPQDIEWAVEQIARASRPATSPLSRSPRRAARRRRRCWSSAGPPTRRSAAG